MAKRFQAPTLWQLVDNRIEQLKHDPDPEYRRIATAQLEAFFDYHTVAGAAAGPPREPRSETEAAALRALEAANAALRQYMDRM
jgi:hypothetical protein